MHGIEWFVRLSSNTKIPVSLVTQSTNLYVYCPVWFTTKVVPKNVTKVDNNLTTRVVVNLITKWSSLALPGWANAVPPNPSGLPAHLLYRVFDLGRPPVISLAITKC